ncbi:hypothetical protein [Nocardiopsis synnemataformans]|uniref:hypothetical protein n=1 Tax=Nocardiopsis synnemataformans TaxID=61305 RepID=UPI003EB8103D
MAEKISFPQAVVNDVAKAIDALGPSPAPEAASHAVAQALTGQSLVISRTVYEHDDAQFDVVDGRVITEMSFGTRYAWITKRLGPHHDRLWEEVLLAPDLISRTRSVLKEARVRSDSGTLGGKEAVERLEVARIAGQISQLDYHERRAELYAKQVRGVRFATMLHYRAHQLGEASMEMGRQRARAREATCQATLGRLARAVAAHRDTVTTAFESAEWDERLWGVLDQEQVSLPGAPGQITLTEALAEGRWSTDG